MQAAIEKTTSVRVPNQNRLRGMVKVLRSQLPVTIRQFAQLTFRVNSNSIIGATQAEIEVIRAWREDDLHVYLPRQFFHREIAPLGLNHVVADERAKGAPADWKMKPEFQLRHTAKCNQQAAVDALAASDAGSLACFPAAGKTVMALAAASRRKRRTLVVVPTVQLLTQWIERALEHTTLKRDQIGVVQGDTCEWDRPLLVATVQSLASHPYPEAFYSGVGVTIWDEQHRMSAPHFSEAMMLFPAQVRWGLSATIERRDGLHRIFEYHTGGVVYEMREHEIAVQIHMLRTGIRFEPHQYQNPWNRKFNHSRMLNSLAKNTPRNRLLSRELVKALKAGRKVIALSHRLDQIAAIRREVVALGIPEAQVGVIVGATSAGERQRVLKESRLVIAVYQIAGFALDEPSLDTLFCLTPSQDVEQYVGRIQREYPDKKEPVVVDPLDNAEPTLALGGSRIQQYRKLQFEVRHVSGHV
jgi:superfamily II DNA or RNA helicase